MWFEIINSNFLSIYLFNSKINQEIFDEDNDTDGIYKVTEVKDGKFRIYGPKGRVNWIVYGSRGDIEVEPLRSNVDVKGNGPYKWI